MRGRYLILVILTLLAVSSRLLPLAISPLPYNNDAMLECRIAEDILDSGSLSYPDEANYVDSHSVITPVYNSLLAYVSSLTGFGPFETAQFVIAAISIVTVIGTYLLALRICRSASGATVAAMVVSLFGTFAFLTGSAWKESLGVALMVLLAYTYARRTDNRMLAIEIAILGILPMVHHLVALIAYLSIAYLTAWSTVFAIVNSGIRRRHFIDMTVIGVMGALTYWYYYMNSLGRLSYVDTLQDVCLVVAPFVAFLLITSFVLMRRRHFKGTFAPIPAIVILGLLAWDYFDPIFPYEPTLIGNILTISILTSILVALAWYGMELIIESNSELRAIPVGFLLPVLTLFAFAIGGGLDIDSHKIFYRTYDFADLSLALGVAIVFSSFNRRPNTKTILAAAVIVILLVSFPFAYMTNELVGIRHDTQEHEVDALKWVDGASDGVFSLRSDERIAYVGHAVFDIGKSPYLPSMLDERTLSTSRFLNLYVEEWSTIGVNDYPRGHPVVNASYVGQVLEASNVLYVSGPVDNNLVIYQTGPFGRLLVFG